MAKLVGTINRWVGVSRETKPYPGMWDAEAGAMLTAADVPVGSVFYEQDTGWEYTYKGESIWQLSPDSGRTMLLIAKLNELLGVQQEGLSELRAIKTGIERALEESLEGA